MHLTPKNQKHVAVAPQKPKTDSLLRDEGCRGPLGDFPMSSKERSKASCGKIVKKTIRKPESNQNDCSPVFVLSKIHRNNRSQNRQINIS